MIRLVPSFLAVLLTTLAAPAFADVIPYPNPGVIAPQVKTYATSSGGVHVYYYGSTANDTDFVEVYDVQTQYNSGEILNNHATAVGTEITVGTGSGPINAGDQLVFFIEAPDGSYGSIAGYSEDGINHAYITGYSGGTVGGTVVPSGLFVGLEDLYYPGSDLNYNDDDFIFTGVSAPSATGVTPEPASLALFGTGLFGILGTIKRRMSMHG